MILIIKKNILINFVFCLYSLNCYAVSLNKENPVYYYVNHQTELQLIKDHLLKSNVVGVTGVAGIGKSELIKKYVEQYENDYEIIAIFNASSNLNAQYLDLIHGINRNICVKDGCNISENPKYAKDNLLKYLEKETKWLLIFDNVRIKENIKLKDIINWQHNGHIIICSQEGNYLDYQIKMSYLDKKSSDLLIRKIMKNPSQKYIESLNKLFKGYPYMIATSAIYLHNHPHVTIDDYSNYMIKKDNKVKAHLELCLDAMDKQSKELINIFMILDSQRVSRAVIEMFFNKDGLIRSIEELINYGLIEQINKDPEMQEFRMHDAIKKELIKLTINKDKIIDSLLARLNEYLPLNQTVPVRYSLISQPTMLSNIEILLENAEKYKANIYKTMRGNDILLDHYLKTKDWQSCQQKSDWLINIQELISLDKMTHENKITYGHYLTNIGVYQDFAFSHFNAAIKYYEQAKKILNTTTGYYLIYNTAYYQEAITYLGIGDISKAKENILIIEKVLNNNNIDIKSDRVLAGKAIISLAEGNYNKALEEINILLDSEFHLSNEIVTLKMHLIKAEILNYIGSFQEAYDICKPLYDQRSKYFNSPHEMLASLITQMSRAELGLGEVNKAIQHIQQAVEFFEQEYIALKHKQPINDKFAASLTTRGDVLLAEKKFKEAIRDYNYAKKIYFNRYRNNAKNMDNVSYNLFQLVNAAYSDNDYKLYKKVRDDLFNQFGIDHPKSQQVISLYEKQSKF